VSDELGSEPLSADDDELLSRLGPVLAAVDPVPPLVTAAARSAWELRALDAELAELVRDSADESAGLAGVRGVSAPRLLTFEVAGGSLEVEVSGSGARRRLVGQVSGAPVTGLVLEVPGERTPWPVDEQGRFSGEAPAGPFRLRVQLAGREVATSWVLA
jgi:hypothetical protein